MKALLLTLLFAGSFASASGEWTTKSQKTVAKTGEICTLTIESLIVTPINGEDEYSQPFVNYNKLLNQIAIETAKMYFEAIGEYSDGRCAKSRDGGLSAEVTTKLSYKTPKWSSWEQSSAGYLGGAHGYAEVDYLVISAEGEQVTFDMVLDVSIDTFMKTIITKLKAKDRYNEESFAIWKDGDDVIERLNYSADDKGISIFFNSYDIASYADGPTEIFYSWEELKSILRKKSIFENQLK